MRLRRPGLRDAEDFIAAMSRSRSLHRAWVRPPRDRDQYVQYLARLRSDRFDSFLVERTADGVLVGVVSLSQITGANLRSAHLEFYAVAALAGQGLMSEAVRQLLRYAFRQRCLQRVEAYVQPGNRASRALLRRCGFRYEGLARRFLKLGGQWRDHQRWVLLRSDRPGSERPRG